MTLSEKIMLAAILAVLASVVAAAFLGCSIEVKPLSVHHHGTVIVRHVHVHERPDYGKVGKALREP